MSDRSGATAPWTFGDRVRLAGKPEWGVGTVTKAQVVKVRDETHWSVTVRFPNAGLKVLNTAAARLERVEAETEDGAGEAAAVIAKVDRMGADSLLGPMAEKQLLEVMTVLPESCRDPFRSLQARIDATIDLYRFDTSGRGLVDWAVAQTGLNDPLSRFNRHELEDHFRRWAMERDRHLARLVHEVRQAGGDTDACLAGAPEIACTAARKTRF